LKKNRRLILGIIILVTVTSVISFAVSAFVLWNFGDFSPNNAIYFDPDEVNPKNIEKFKKVKGILKNSFYESVEEDVLLEGAIAGMASSLQDPYTVYLTKEQMDYYLEKSRGSFYGIGVLVTMDKDGLLTVIETYEDTPAKRAGIMHGDKVTKVDGEDVTQIRDINVIVSMIKGEIGTTVKLTIYRMSENRFVDFEIKRDKIKVVNIESKILEEDIGYIRIIEFDGEIAAYFNEHLDKLIEKGIRGLIIDVRNNPGGSYDQVLEVADRLLPEGVIVSVKDRYGEEIFEKSDKKELDMPIVAIINNNSASASEILAGSLKDYNKGTLVGTRTFGKGLVQSLMELDDGSGIKVTIARYFTPSGVCIHGLGIDPHVEVTLDEKYVNVPITQIPKEDDAQLAEALRIIKEKNK